MIRRLCLGFYSMGLLACAPINEFVNEDAPSVQEWATTFSVREYYCDGPDLEQRILPCSLPLSKVSIVQHFPDQICLHAQGELLGMPWACFSGYRPAASHFEVALRSDEMGFRYLRQSPLMQPGPYHRLRITLRKIDSGWVLIEDVQESRLDLSGRRQVLYLILEKA